MKLRSESEQRAAKGLAKPSSGCLSEQGVESEPDCLVPPFSLLPSTHPCPCGTFRLPQAAWIHRDAQRQLPQRSRDGGLHEPHARPRQRGAVREHPSRKAGPRADGRSALRPRDGREHGRHAPSGGIWNVSPSGHEQEGRGPLDAPRTHELHTQQVGTRRSAQTSHDLQEGFSASHVRAGPPRL